MRACATCCGVLPYRVPCRKFPTMSHAACPPAPASSHNSFRTPICIMELREKRSRQAWSPVELDEESGLSSSDGEGEAEFSDDDDDSRECGPFEGLRGRGMPEICLMWHGPVPFCLLLPQRPAATSCITVTHALLHACRQGQVGAVLEGHARVEVSEGFGAGRRRVGEFVVINIDWWRPQGGRWTPAAGSAPWACWLKASIRREFQPVAAGGVGFWRLRCLYRRSPGSRGRGRASTAAAPRQRSYPSLPALPHPLAFLTPPCRSFVQEAKPKAILQKMGAYGTQLTTIQVRRQAAAAARWRRRRRVF